jgi:glycyl-tRNA synthetase beta subunit
MAFGIDDAISAAAAGVSLADTLVETIKKYKAEKKDYDLEQLIDAVRGTALSRLKEIDAALDEFEQMLKRREIDLSQTIEHVIGLTPFWKPFEQHRLAQIQRRFCEFLGAISASTDDIAALVRCHGQTSQMGMAVVNTVKTKRQFRDQVNNAKSMGEAFVRLRKEIDRQRVMLSNA